MEEIERTLLVKPEVFVYKIPPRPSARGYRAADWNLTNPDYTGRMRVLNKGKSCEIRLEDKSSGELFAACPVEHYPGSSVESVTDSSRYFVICVQGQGRKAFIGIGFADRADSFDLNVALQDHFKWVKKEEGFSKEAEQGPEKKLNLNLAFKEGQTIRINIPKRDGHNSNFDDGEDEFSAAGPCSSTKPRPTKSASSSSGFLPPPPGGVKICPPPPGTSNLTPMQSPTEPTAKSVIGGFPPTSSSSTRAPAGGAASNVDLLGDLLGSSSLLSSSNPAPLSSTSKANTGSSNDDPWGDFASAPTTKTASSGNWTNFE